MEKKVTAWFGGEGKQALIEKWRIENPGKASLYTGKVQKPLRPQKTYKDKSSGQYADGYNMLTHMKFGDNNTQGLM